MQLFVNGVEAREATGSARHRRQPVVAWRPRPRNRSPSTSARPPVPSRTAEGCRIAATDGNRTPAGGRRLRTGLFIGQRRATIIWRRSEVDPQLESRYRVAGPGRMTRDVFAVSIRPTGHRVRPTWPRVPTPGRHRRATVRFINREQRRRDGRFPWSPPRFRVPSSSCPTALGARAGGRCARGGRRLRQRASGPQGSRANSWSAPGW